MIKIKLALRIWAPLATASILLSGLIYISVQQSFRQSANDPQIQIATDLAEGLQNGANAKELVGLDQVDLNKSLATYLIIFDDLGAPLASSAVLDGRIPTPPAGVFTYTKQNKQDRFTWEPKPKVRQAAVLIRFEGSKPGFVLVGRSLQEVEKRISQLDFQIKLGLVVTLLLSFIVTFVFSGV